MANSKRLAKKNLYERISNIDLSNKSYRENLQFRFESNHTTPEGITKSSYSEMNRETKFESNSIYYTNVSIINNEPDYSCCTFNFEYEELYLQDKSYIKLKDLGMFDKNTKLQIIKGEWYLKEKEFDGFKEIYLDALYAPKFTEISNFESLIKDSKLIESSNTSGRFIVRNKMSLLEELGISRNDFDFEVASDYRTELYIEFNDDKIIIEITIKNLKEKFYDEYIDPVDYKFTYTLSNFDKINLKDVKNSVELNYIDLSDVIAIQNSINIDAISNYSTKNSSSNNVTIMAYSLLDDDKIICYDTECVNYFQNTIPYLLELADQNKINLDIYDTGRGAIACINEQNLFKKMISDISISGFIENNGQYYYQINPSKYGGNSFRYNNCKAKAQYWVNGVTQSNFQNEYFCPKILNSYFVINSESSKKCFLFPDKKDIDSFLSN